MSITYINSTVSNPQIPKKREQGRFLVDSGAVFTVAPETFLQKIGIMPTHTQKFSLANGEVIEKKSGMRTFRTGEKPQHRR